MLPINIEDVLRKYRGFIERAIIHWTWGQMYTEGDREEIFSWVLNRLQKQGEIEAKYGEKSLKCFLYRTTRRTVVDYYRRRKKKKIQEVKLSLEDDDGGDGGDWMGRVAASPEEEMSIDDQAQEVRNMIVIMKEHRRVRHSAILMDRVNGLSRSEIAKKHGLTVSQVRGQLYYSRKCLARDWQRFQASRKLERLAQQGKKDF